MAAAGADERGARPRPAAAYRRSAGTPRGEARRAQLLERVVDDLAANGLVDFSLRRAARAAGTTHKVLLYYFDGADGLLTEAVLQLRERRIARSLDAAMQAPGQQTLAARVRGVWAALASEESRALDQAIGLTMFDPARYARLGATASERYIPGLMSICPPEWSDGRKLEVAEMIMAVLRGFIVEWLTSANSAAVEAGFAALVRALEREEAAAEEPLDSL
jgi:AcrR family transcriptional regulator